MKKLFLLATVLFATCTISWAQGLQLYPFAGYTFADRFPISGGTARIGDGFTYGGALAFVVSDYYAVELKYSRMDADVSAYSPYNNIDIYGEPVSLNYILLGGSKLFPVSEEAILFSGLNLGVGIMGSKDDTFNTITKFAAGINAGVKYFFTKSAGIRLQANLDFPVTDVGGSLWWSPGSGTQVGVSSYVPFLQFGFTGGLVLKLK